MSPEEQPVQNQRPESPKGLGASRRRGRRGGRGRSRAPRRQPAISTQIPPVPGAAAHDDLAGDPPEEISSPEETFEEAEPMSEPLPDPLLESSPYPAAEPEPVSDHPELPLSTDPAPEPIESFAPVEPAPESPAPLVQPEAADAPAPAAAHPAPASRPPAPLPVAPSRPAPIARPLRPAPAPYQPPRPFQPAAASAVSQAIEEVTKIVDALRLALDQMDEVLELVEIAERRRTRN
jgi:hypothetical protein